MTHADRKHDADNVEDQHLAALYVRAPNKDLSSHQRRHKALKEMSDFVVRITIETQAVRNLEAEGDPGIGVGGAQHEYQRVQRDAEVQQRCRGKALVRT